MDDPSAVATNSLRPPWEGSRARQVEAISATEPAWLTVLADPAIPVSAKRLDWLATLGRAAEAFLLAAEHTPGPLEVWIVDVADLGHAQVTAASEVCDDGVARMAMSQRTTPWGVGHEFGHYLTGQAWREPIAAGSLDFLAGILLEEYLAQRLGQILVGRICLPKGAEVMRQAELSDQARLLVADYRTARSAIAAVIESGRATPALGRSFTPLARSLAYFAGARANESLPLALPKGLRIQIDGPLSAALARVDASTDVWLDRSGLLARVGLAPALADIITEVMSNAQRATPWERRTPGWTAAFASA